MAEILRLTAQIAAAYLRANSARTEDVPGIIRMIRDVLDEDVAPPTSKATTNDVSLNATTAQIRRSVSDEALISFINGKSYRTLKLHVSGHGMTFQQYREKYGLPNDYPSVASQFRRERSETALRTGLGRGGKPTPAKVGRPKAR